MTDDTRASATSRRVRTLGALATVLLVALVGAPAVPAAASTPTATTTSISSDATGASRDARVLRRETATLLTSYLTEFGDRFTESENDQLRAYRADADRQLAVVVVTTRRLQSAVADRAPRSEVLAAGRAAQRAHKRARATAQASYEGARRIMEPRLSLFEGIAAMRDYDGMLGRFDDLGERIDAVVAAAR